MLVQTIVIFNSHWYCLSKIQVSVQHNNWLFSEQATFRGENNMQDNERYISQGSVVTFLRSRGQCKITCVKIIQDSVYQLWKLVHFWLKYLRNILCWRFLEHLVVWYYAILCICHIDSITGRQDVSFSRVAVFVYLRIYVFEFIVTQFTCVFLCMQGDNVGCAEYVLHVSPLFAGVTDHQLCIIQVWLHSSLQLLIRVVPVHFFCI